MNIQIKLKTTAYAIEDRLPEVREIREWLDQLVEWDKDKYSMRFHSSGNAVIIWFEEEKHAMLCLLRWS